MPMTREREFSFTFGSKGVLSKLTVPVTIPLSQSVEDLEGRLIKEHNLPCYVEHALHEQLEEFVSEETTTLQDENAEEAADRVRNGDVDINKVVEEWTQTFSEEVIECTKPENVTNESVFSEVYHALIHSPALDTLLNLEHTYALDVAQVIDQRDKDVVLTDKKQSHEMENAVLKVGKSYSTEDVNLLAQRHFENTQLIESKWASELSNLQETQKREYRNWVMTVHEDTQAKAQTPDYVTLLTPISHFVQFSQQLQSRARSSRSNAMELEGEEGSQNNRIEESFTIHLGAQLKTMHNLRLISADVLDLCKHRVINKSGNIIPQPQRLQTAMSLYSNNLCGMVLLVDNRLNTYVGIKREFAKVCQQSTDFHFPDLEQQFERIEQEIIKANVMRSQQKVSMDDGDKISLKSTGSHSSSERDDKNLKMQCGDFYITKHSNLLEVHTVFHLVVDESIRSSELSSRHPVILGYRNIIKACFKYDVMTITLPLLLTHEMSEEMTIPWCLKRAELVFKCVKGFMMELATWGGTESRTIQFLIPRGMSEETFSAISNMLPTIYRMSTAVIARI